MSLSTSVLPATSFNMPINSAVRSPALIHLFNIQTVVFAGVLFTDSARKFSYSPPNCSMKCTIAPGSPK